MGQEPAGDDRSTLGTPTVIRRRRHLTLLETETGWRKSHIEEQLPSRHRRLRSRPYLTIRTRFVLSVACGLAWAAFAIWISLAWLAQLGQSITLPAAIALLAGLVFVPAYASAQLVATLVLDRPRPLRFLQRYPALTLVLSVRDERDRIEETLTYVLRSDYPGELTVVVVDDGSTDGTHEIVNAMSFVDDRLELIRVARQGRAQSLNHALERVSTPLVATIHADTVLMPYSLRHAVARLLGAPPDTVAVAGSVLVRNSRDGLLARMQEWEYFLGIASARRQQAFLQATLEAPSAFSVYDLRALKAVGGWPSSPGNDLSLTLAMIRDGGRTTFEPSAIAFGEAPSNLPRFAEQRHRWARSRIDGLREHGRSLLRSRRLAAHSVALDYLHPYLDAAYAFAVVPGLILALTGNFAIVGPLLVAVLPMAISASLVMFLHQRRVFAKLGLRVRWNLLGFVLYLLAYQILLAPISLAGYVRGLSEARRES